MTGLKLTLASAVILAVSSAGTASSSGGGCQFARGSDRDVARCIEECSKRYPEEECHHRCQW